VKKACAIILASLFLSACAAHLDSSGFSSQAPAAIRGIGYATVSNQPGKTAAQKQLMAIRASRLMAMRSEERRVGKERRSRWSPYQQKTAYEIYQCDWSSDVCSSDLLCHRLQPTG